jgi:hypothetical protein
MSHLVTSSGSSSLVSLSYLTPVFCIRFVCVRPHYFAPLLLSRLSHVLSPRRCMIHHVVPPLFSPPLSSSWFRCSLSASSLVFSSCIVPFTTAPLSSSCSPPPAPLCTLSVSSFFPPIAHHPSYVLLSLVSSPRFSFSRSWLHHSPHACAPSPSLTFFPRSTLGGLL